MIQSDFCVPPMDKHFFHYISSSNDQMWRRICTWPLNLFWRWTNELDNITWFHCFWIGPKIWHFLQSSPSHSHPWWQCLQPFPPQRLQTAWERSDIDRQKFTLLCNCKTSNNLPANFAGEHSIVAIIFHSVFNQFSQFVELFACDVHVVCVLDVLIIMHWDPSEWVCGTVIYPSTLSDAKSFFHAVSQTSSLKWPFMMRWYARTRL